MTKDDGNRGFYDRPMAYKQAQTYYEIGKVLIDSVEKRLLNSRLKDTTAKS